MIKTSRLLIRPLEVKDAQVYTELRNQDFVRKYNVMELLTKDEAEEMIKNLKEGEVWAIESLDDKSYIGTIYKNQDSLRFGTGTCEISYWLGQKFANKGYMKEALKAFIEYLFSKNYKGITVRAFEDNVYSAKLLEDLGFVREGRLTNAVKSTDGVIHTDLLFYLAK